MCRYTAILVYDGLVERAIVFDEFSRAEEWLRESRQASGIENCAGSVIWDHQVDEPTHMKQDDLAK